MAEAIMTGRVVMKMKDGTFKYRYRLIAEKALGCPMPAGVQIHHLNEDGRDDANINLVICEDEKYHKLLHHRQRIVRAGGNPDTEAICNVCNNVLPHTAFNIRKASIHGRCFTCRKCSNAKCRDWYNNGGGEKLRTSEAVRQYRKKYWSERGKILRKERRSV